MGRVIEGQLTATGLRFAIIVSRFNSFITERLHQGAMDALARSGADLNLVDLIRVPGSWEVPLVASEVARQHRHDAIICLACVIRGETPHFDYVAGECARGLMDAGLATGVPVIFGVLTTENQAQAEERASLTRMNKGGESMEAALEMIELLAPFGQSSKARSRKASARKVAAKGARKSRVRR